MSKETSLSRRVRRTAGFAIVTGTTLATMVLTSATSGADAVTAKDTAIDVKIDGGCVAHIANFGAKYNSVLPLSGNPFTREMFLTDHGSVTLNCPKGAKLPKKYTLEVGYQIAPNIDVSDGWALGITPQIASGTNTTTNQTTNTTTISTPTSIKLKAGQITEVVVQKREWTNEKSDVPKNAKININNWHTQLNNAAGFISIRSYTKLVSSGSSTDDINVDYGPAVVLR